MGKATLHTAMIALGVIVVVAQAKKGTFGASVQSITTSMGV